MSKTLLTLVFGLILVGCQHVPSTDNTDGMEESMINKEDTMHNDGSMEEKGEAMMQDNTMYKEYSAESMAELKGNQPFVVFFHADWCPTCKAWEAKIMESMARLPENTVILKADYDTEEALLQELGVTQQSTAVFFDASGEVVKIATDPSIEVVTEHFSS